MYLAKLVSLKLLGDAAFSQKIFDENVDSNNIYGMKLVMSMNDQIVPTEKALDLACKSGDDELMTLLLNHPKVLPLEVHLSKAVSYINYHAVHRLLRDGRVSSRALYADQWSTLEIANFKGIPFEIMDGILTGDLEQLQNSEYKAILPNEIDLLWERSRRHPASRAALLRGYVSSKFNFSENHQDELVEFLKFIDKGLSIQQIALAFRFFNMIRGGDISDDICRQIALYASETLRPPNLTDVQVKVSEMIGPNQKPRVLHAVVLLAGLIHYIWPIIVPFGARIFLLLIGIMALSISRFKEIWGYLMGTIVEDNSSPARAAYFMELRSTVHFGIVVLCLLAILAIWQSIGM